MTCELAALCFDASDPVRVARFWAGALNWEIADDPSGGVALLPGDDTSFRFRFVPARGEQTGPDLIHFHVTSTSIDDQQQTVDRLLSLGARHIDIGQRPEEGHVVLADPDGFALCVIEPGNNFLADCGFFAEVSCEGSQEVGYFWSTVLGWPLVWDQNQETAIRSPGGGPKVSWGGPPLTPNARKNRVHFDLAPPAGGDQQAEVQRLVSLGATRLDSGQGGVRWVVMADPDGHEFCVLPPGA